MQRTARWSLSSWLNNSVGLPPGAQRVRAPGRRATAQLPAGACPPHQLTFEASPTAQGLMPIEFLPPVRVAEELGSQRGYRHQLRFTRCDVRWRCFQNPCRLRRGKLRGSCGTFSARMSWPRRLPDQISEKTRSTGYNHLGRRPRQPSKTAKMVDAGQKGCRQVLRRDIPKIYFSGEGMALPGAGLWNALPGARILTQLLRARVQRRVETNKIRFSPFGCVGHT
ncbi:hypothetical protein ACVJGD_008458 [Bradyrhizobium sp. USDA 10063]